MNVLLRRLPRPLRPATTRTLAAFFLSPLLSQCQTAQPAVDFNAEVHPILASRCLGCHSQEKRSGGLSLNTYDNALAGGRSGAAIRPGDAKRSLLMQRITGETEPRMPPGGPALNEASIAIIRDWIDQGARATPTSAPAKPKWEAPLSLEQPAVPQQVWAGWNSPVDRFVAAYLAGNKMTEPQPVSDAQFARRVYLDVWGLLPNPNELRTFLGDKSADKRDRLASRLLADSDKYAEHWITFWNDLLRNDEGTTYHSETASRKSITEWLLGSLKNNRPYDEMVSNLLNPRTAADPRGFLTGVNWRGTVSASQSPAMQAAQNSAQIFLGVNLKCNACHDSFISKWKLKDAYAMASYFSPTAKLQLYRCDVAQQAFAEPAFLYAELNRTPPSSSLKDRRATAAAIFTDSRNGRLPRTMVNRIWQRLLGHGLVDDPDDMDGEPWNAALLDWLASDFVEHHYDLKRLVAVIVSSRAYQMPAVPRAEESKKYVFRGPEVRRLTAEQFGDAVGAITGEWSVYEPPERQVSRPDDDPDSQGFAPAVATQNLSGAAHSGIGDPGVAGAEAAHARGQSGARGSPAAEAPRTPEEVQPSSPPPGVYTREWRVAATSLTRALGRPIRDQVYSTRESRATTLQALELVNGETLTNRLLRGAQRMVGELPPEPASLFDRPWRKTGVGASFDIDISGARKLWLLVQDAGSYSPERVEAVWAGAELIGPNGATPLKALSPMEQSGVRAAEGPIQLNGATANGIRVKAPSRLVYDIGGKGYKRLRGLAGLEGKEHANDISPNVRFFIFAEEPNMERLTAVGAATPLPGEGPLKSAAAIVDRVFWYALGREPSAAERKTAESALFDPAHPGRPPAEGLADLLWAMMMKSEFQLIY